MYLPHLYMTCLYLQTSGKQILIMEDLPKWEKTDGALVFFGRAQMEVCTWVIYSRKKCGRKLVEVQFEAILCRAMANIRHLITRGLGYKAYILSTEVQGKVRMPSLWETLL